jgi:DNA polymerase-3 subunit epsilon
MSLLQRWFGGAPDVDEARWVVVDVETTGLDVARDRLLAIAAIAVRFTPQPVIDLRDSFEVVLRQDTAAVAPAAIDRDNILLHGIGVGEQRAGVDPPVALADFERYVGRSPLLGFHAEFDRAMIGRASRTVLGRVAPNPWLDLEPVAAVVRRDVRARSLDEWMAVFGITCLRRHQAAADTLATAELLLALWPAVQRECGPTPRFADLRKLADSRRWVGQH